MSANRLQDALRQLSAAIQEADAALEEMRAEPDPLAVHIFVSLRQYRYMARHQGRKRHAMAARLSWQAACELGFRGNARRMGKIDGCGI
jgi:hypothetical protein